MVANVSPAAIAVFLVVFQHLGASVRQSSVFRHLIRWDLFSDQNGPHNARKTLSDFFCVRHVAPACFSDATWRLIAAAPP
jgi:hypothetical protein